MRTPARETTGGRPVLLCARLAVPYLLFGCLVGCRRVPANGKVDPHPEKTTAGRTHAPHHDHAASLTSGIPAAWNPRVLTIGSAATADVIMGVSFTPDCTRLAVVSGSGVTVWDLSKLSLIRKVTGATLDGVAVANIQFDLHPIFSADGDRVMFGTVEPQATLQWWSISSGSRLSLWRDRQISADGSSLINRRQRSNAQVTNPPNADVRFYDLYDNRQYGLLRCQHDGEEAFCISPVKRWVAVGDAYAGASDGVVRVYNLRTGRLHTQVSDDRGDPSLADGACGPMAFSDDATLLATNGSDPKFRVGHNPENPGAPVSEAATWRALPVKLWNVRTGKLIHMWPGQGMYTQPIFLRGGKRLAAIGAERLDVWSVDTGRLLWSARFINLGTQGAAILAPDHRTLAFVGQRAISFATLPAPLETIAWQAAPAAPGPVER